MNAPTHHLVRTALALFALAYAGTLQAAEPGTPRAKYVGSVVCADCHVVVAKAYAESGHAYAMVAPGGAAPAYPPHTSPGVPAPPVDLNWSKLSYVIGGYAWKANFMDAEGYVLTGPRAREYALPNAGLDANARWSAYEAHQAPRKPYDCGGCHSTGWSAAGPGSNSPGQGDLPGVRGRWSEPGVTCEACHGPGGDHVLRPSTTNISRAENCADCHRRGDPTKIETENGLILHEAQAEELRASPHRTLGCGSCHDPHRSVIYGAGVEQGGRRTCLECHPKQTVELAGKDRFECVSCHMPRIIRAAGSVVRNYAGGDVPEGDIRGHLFRIDPDPGWRMFTPDGRALHLDGRGQGAIAIEYACLGCHGDKDEAWARRMAAQVHPKD